MSSVGCKYCLSTGKVKQKQFMDIAVEGVDLEELVECPVCCGSGDGFVRSSFEQGKFKYILKEASEVE